VFGVRLLHFLDNCFHGVGQWIQVPVFSRTTDDLALIHARYFVNAAEVTAVSIRGHGAIVENPPSGSMSE
jgi:hypothetical protein